jgi:hypothetical protein
MVFGFIFVVESWSWRELGAPGGLDKILGKRCFWPFWAGCRDPSLGVLGFTKDSAASG